MFSKTPIFEPTSNTILGEAFISHGQKYANDKTYSVGNVECAWLNALFDAAKLRSDSNLLIFIDKLIKLLECPPLAGNNFKDEFRTIYQKACSYAYPLTWLIIEKHQDILGLTFDYALHCFDMGMLRVMEDQAVLDIEMKAFISSMLARMKKKARTPDHEVFRATFDIYSEAIVYHLLKTRTGDKLRIKKIPEAKTPTPDFECELDVVVNNQTRTLKFYIEVKAFDIVDAPQRYPEMLNEGMEAQIDLERQKAQGRRVAITTTELAPYKPYGEDPEYSPWSLRNVIEVLINKAKNNFKSSQFQCGPTFALANLMRLSPLGQGASTLAPSFYQKYGGGACVSGILWHLAFGKVGYPIYRLPHFEGAKTNDGELTTDGFLVDEDVPSVAGLIVLHFDDEKYRLDGLFDSHWSHAVSGWSDIEVGEVIHALCGDYNTRENERAHDYALHLPKRK